MMRLEDFDARFNIANLLALTITSFRQQLGKLFCQRGYSITVEQFYALKFLRQNESVKQKDLEPLTLKEQPALTKILQKLEKQGYIRRIPGDRDRREKYICMTEEGVKLQQELFKLCQEHLASVTSALTEAENELLKVFLLRMITSINNTQI